MKINKQLTHGVPRNIQSSIFRGKMDFLGRSSQFNTFSRGGGRSRRSQGRAGYTYHVSNLICVAGGFSKKDTRMGKDNFRFMDSQIL